MRVEEVGDAYLLRSVVLGPSAAAAVPDVISTLLRRNRSRTPIGFRRDARGRVVGEVGCQPDGEILRMLLDRLATECDTLEQVLSGVDRS